MTMHKRLSASLFLIFFWLFLPIAAISATQGQEEQTQKPLLSDATIAPAEKMQETADMLASLIELQANLKEQISLSRKKLKASTSDTEKQHLETELQKLDRQLSETSRDFERIATGVEPSLFVDKAPESFNWKEEISSLVEPAIKELKRLTIRARQRTKLKETITELDKLSTTATDAISHMEEVEGLSDNKEVNKRIEALLPEWKTISKRLKRKQELAEMELNQLEKQDVSLVESSSNSVRAFFRDRGRFLVVALLAFVAILLVSRLLYRFFFVFIPRKLSKNKEQRSFHVRLIDIIFQGAAFFLAICGSFMVLYLAEDWFLLSLTIIFVIGLVWTIRQGVPRLWQQGRLMLNIGSVREKERITLYGVPWRVDAINVFCLLTNPTLNISLRIPIEQLVGTTSRKYNPEEPWFPCKKGDWVVVGDAPRARVVSQSHEMIELVERGGTRRVYPTETFLAGCPQNLSRNFRLRTVFGLSYALQDSVTSSIPVILHDYIEEQLKGSEYGQSCMNLIVEFMQAGSSSLDLLVLADFKGDVADICKRIERALQKWCVECATLHQWEIPFPQVTMHWPVWENRQENQAQPPSE